jgi:hypothetical protein
MELIWMYFSKAYELTDYIKKHNIKRENIQGIFINANGTCVA